MALHPGMVKNAEKTIMSNAKQYAKRRVIDTNGCIDMQYEPICNEYMLAVVRQFVVPFTS